MKGERNILKYLPKDDVIFKNLFSSKESKEMLKEFLESIIGIKIHSLEVQKEVETSMMNVKEKYGRLDLRIDINDDTIVVIEMQNSNKGRMDKRAVFYAGKIIASSLEVGESYNDMKDIIVINILNYKMNEIPEYKVETITVDSKYRKYTVIEGVKYYFIELPKFREMVNKPQNKLEEWLSFIDYEKEEMVEMAVKNNELVKKAKLTYEYLTGDEATKRLEFLKEKALRDEAAVRHQAREEGRKFEKIEVAKEMLKNKIAKSVIIQCTGLSEIEIEEIAK
ncbi:MAG: Rpn family recombination-promoting nuclease/putative transposase [Clostridia bacterium]|nr:Rpn family recombination-promoting nuclease/putative transposase [Clostridia bacterium]